MLPLIRALLLLPLVVTATPAIAELSAADSERLAGVLAAQPAERRARYDGRHPAETLTFFGIRPGMRVMEVLPGSGWYSPILVSYLGAEGALVGADYPIELWSKFPFASDQFLAQRRSWPDKFAADGRDWGAGGGAPVSAMALGSLDPELDGTLDAVVFIRALHNLNRYEPEGGFRTQALQDAFRVLKPGGVLGVVQHEAPAALGEAWADGSRGYLNRDLLVRQIEAVGFTLLAESDVNRNPRDVPGEDDFVWRLPPSLQTSRDNPELRARFEAIGESNRMTLKFRKPAD
jgi:predicted methyltransferase